MTEIARTDGATSGNLLLDIANTFVAIHKDYFGRGPTKARAQVSRDVVVVLLEGGYSRAEQTLREHGRDEVVNEGRMAMQATIEQAGVEAIERLVGRRVYSFMSANDPSKELQAEVFVLESSDNTVPPSHERSDLAERARVAREENAEVREDLRALRAEQAQAREKLRRCREHED
jgi:uncharacterized protein YbcI